jgi:hypothetical protein
MDLLVIPSVNEGLSNALIESMACGVPALAARESLPALGAAARHTIVSRFSFPSMADGYTRLYRQLSPAIP